MGNIKKCVSLYSLQYQYMHGKMNLDAIFAFMEELGVGGLKSFRIRCFMALRNRLKKPIRNGNS